jgi:hypothetical protein
MARTLGPGQTSLAAGQHRGASPGRWLLQDAKARFSELVRRAKTDGPQLVTVHGREEVVYVKFHSISGRVIISQFGYPACS